MHLLLYLKYALLLLVFLAGAWTEWKYHWVEMLPFVKP